MNISQLPTDVIGHILGFLPAQLALTNKQVCTRWRSIINNWLFQAQNYPDFNTKRLPLRSKAQLVADMNAYKNPDPNSPYDIRKASFKRSLADIPLSSIDVHYQKLSISGYALHQVRESAYKQMDMLFSKLKSSMANPASVSLKNLRIGETICFFSICIRRNIFLQKLKLSICSEPFEAEGRLLRATLERLADNFQLVVPFHLDLGKESWISVDCLEKLYRKGIRFSHITARGIPSYHVFPQIPASQLTIPCTLVTKQPMSSSFIVSVFERQLKLNCMDLCQHLSDEAVATLFESHVVSPFKVTMFRSTLTARVLEVISRKDVIFEKLKIRTEMSYSTHNVEATTWKNFLSQNRVKSLSIENGTTIPLEFFQCFPDKLATANRLEKLKISNVDLASLQFIAYSALFERKNVSLSVDTRLASYVSVSFLNKPSLKFKKLYFIPTTGCTQSIMPLVVNGLLNNCEQLMLNFTFINQAQIIQALAQTNFELRTLQCSLDPLVIATLQNPKNFPLLNELIINGTNEELWQQAEQISPRRPSLRIWFNRYDFLNHTDAA